jgi:hypothetical protein
MKSILCLRHLLTPLPFCLQGASHAVLISRPDIVAQTIMDAAAAV